MRQTHATTKRIDLGEACGQAMYIPAGTPCDVTETRNQRGELVNAVGHFRNDAGSVTSVPLMVGEYKVVRK